MHPQARTENEVIYIYRQLVADGYLVTPKGDTWTIIEPQDRYMPQQRVSVRTMREAMMWAEGVEAIRFIHAEFLT